MVQKLQHNVTIKGTKDGLVLLLDDKCSFDLLVEELNDKLTAGSSQMLSGPVISVKVKAGNRYLTAEQEEKLIEVLKQKENLILDHIESDVITKAEAEEMRKDAQVVTVSKVVRSGQVLDIQGDLLLVGDVNPGATVMATGNIYILGSLKGIAHCGTKGNEEAIIAASVMKPSQLRIAHHINRAPDSYPELGNEMEFAYISNEEKQIRIDRISAVHRLRPKLNSLL
ncbi:MULTISPECIES: septum site-determining protein MinC [Fictibacillus]|uniref:septum site-determining protein MinC n=1 Tax=Fictibacillus TaxID=1329200 RepID=UPI0018CE7FBE|nr:MULTISPECIES: septum site-determining protein MinC [unclassified Fictibacillus]MBH0157712.1 septum site-determining protein MinC [Fictibacillus sp. 5RED26]MBH0159934.1 septum site-determining protein MinC [Fictibacillus sp. 26RED30]MBH0163314.1 septum site-determining protein MinC [Fictibacillus sp. 7GRE50]MBH0175108.1 septum site-determining protein MinC [Fictibacillus sp. 23RED33]